MEYSDQELAKRMKQRLAKERERQRRWRVRQKEKGLKPIAGMISAEAFAVLDQEKKKTGATTSTVLENALLNLKQPEPESPQPPQAVAPQESPANPLPVPSAEDHPDHRDAIIDRIKKMRREQNLPFNEIARKFNKDGLRPPAGEEAWDGKIIYTIFKNLEDN